MCPDDGCLRHRSPARTEDRHRLRGRGAARGARRPRRSCACATTCCRSGQRLAPGTSRLPLPGIDRPTTVGSQPPSAWSIAGWARRRSCTAPTTWCHPPGSPRSCRSTTAGSSSIPSRPTRLSAGPAPCCAPRSPAGAVVHTSSHATEAVVRSLFPAAPVRTVHLGPLPLPTPVPTAARRPSWPSAPFVLAIGTLERRKNLPTLVQGIRRARRATTPSLCSCSPAATATTRSAIDAAIDDLGPEPQRAGAAHRPRRRGRAVVAARSTPPCSPTRRSTRASASRCSTRCRPARPWWPSTAGSIPEVAGDAALLCDPLDHLALCRRARHRCSPTTTPAPGSSTRAQPGGGCSTGSAAPTRWSTCTVEWCDGDVDDLR